MDIFQAAGLAEYLFYSGRNRFGLPLKTIYIIPGKDFYGTPQNAEELVAFPDNPICTGFTAGKVIRGDGNNYFIENCEECNDSHLIVFVKDRICIKATYSSSDQPGSSSGGFSLFARQIYTKYLLYSLSRRDEIYPEIKIIGNDAGLLRTLDDVLAASSSDRPVLIYGETGTGKELWANAVHLLSDRSASSLVPVNCAHLRNETMAMSKLFGHKKGAFTGANTDRAGAFKCADGGVLFLDEVEALPEHAQGMLLRTVEYGEIHPLGSDIHTHVDVKIIAATNQDIPSLRENDQLRDDFYFRLRTHYIELLPLRARDPKDILRLASHYMDTLNEKNDQHKYLSDEVRELFLQYDWPGNVRELANVIESAFFGSGYQSRIDVEHLIPQLGRLSAQTPRSRGNHQRKVARLYSALISGEGTFWNLVHSAYLNGELSRIQVQEIIEFALEQHGNLQQVRKSFHINNDHWRKFYLFLYRTIYKGDLPGRNSHS